MKSALINCFPGVWKLTLGTPDPITPHSLLGGREAPELSNLAPCALPFREDEIHWEIRKNGFLVTLPMTEDENLYGMGLQFFSLRQNGTRKTLRTNADPIKDTGDSHAPVPFYASSLGYGVLADTAKCVTFDFGATRKVPDHTAKGSAEKLPGQDTGALYKMQVRSTCVTVFVPQASGLTLYLFAAPTIRGVVERYNLFSGGGSLPPIWGLGNLYRFFGGSTQEDAEAMVQSFLDDQMPISMVGLEPGWHSNAYSCSFKWSKTRFPDPARLIQKVKDAGMHLNVWEQAYVHPTADHYDELRPHSGDYEVWEGLVPDFADPEACRLYGEIQGALIDQGIEGVKLDECDGSVYTGNWFFPGFSAFPSGLTGEEEKNLYGALVQRVINNEFEKRNRRTLSQVRANWSYAAPMNFVLYSDLYDHADFLHAMTSASFCGLLWSPEVRQCDSAEETLRRLQMVVFSPLSLINGWMIPQPLWKQFDIEKNKAGEFLPDDALQDKCRALLKLRNRLVPYLYTAYAQYNKYGTPPFRALAMDSPEDPAVRDINDSYMMGQDILVAPILQGQTGRDVYLPKGAWYDFFTGQRICGRQTIHVETENIPVYVREGALLALGDGSRIQPESDIALDLILYGSDSGSAVLIEDDRVSLDYRNGSQKWHTVTVKSGVLSGALPNGYHLNQIHIIK